MMRYFTFIGAVVFLTAPLLAVDAAATTGRIPGVNAEFDYAGPAGREGFVKSTEEFTGGDGIQHDTDRVWERWGDKSLPSPTIALPLVKGSVEYVRVNSFRDRDLCWRAVADCPATTTVTA